MNAIDIPVHQMSSIYTVIGGGKPRRGRSTELRGARPISDYAVLRSTVSTADKYKYTNNDVIQVSKKEKKETDSNIPPQVCD